MGHKNPIFQGLIILAAEASLYPSMTVSGVTCWEVSIGSRAPSPSPQAFPRLCSLPTPPWRGDEWPPHHPAVQPQPEPWKDSRGLGPIRIPALKLIPCTLCLTAPYLACQRSGDPQPLCLVPSLSPALSSDVACYSEQVMNEGLSTGSRIPSPALRGSLQWTLYFGSQEFTPQVWRELC